MNGGPLPQDPAPCPLCPQSLTSCPLPPLFLAQVFSNEGQFKFRFGVRGRSPGQLQRPTGVAVDTNGDIIVADYDNRWVSIFSPEGKFKVRPPAMLLCTRGGQQRGPVRASWWSGPGLLGPSPAQGSAGLQPGTALLTGQDPGPDGPSFPLDQDWGWPPHGPQGSGRGPERTHHRGGQQVLLRLHLPAQWQAGWPFWGPWGH